MKQDDLRLPEQRQIIHDLVLRMHTTGIPPPEEEILERAEAVENLNDDTRSKE